MGIRTKKVRATGKYARNQYVLSVVKNQSYGNGGCRRAIAVGT